MKDLSGKLAVILHADVAGSTLLVQQDEQLAHQRIRDAFRRFSDTIRRYHGHVRELRGDALLAEFERASDAVMAALAFQSDHLNRLEDLNDDIHPEVRIGIALGEVVIADRTVTGAGVVLAQRVEQLAQPGGLCITSAIHEALPNRMPFSFDDLGGQSLKGFDKSVSVYRVQLSRGESIPPPQQKSRRQLLSVAWWQKLVIVGAALSVIGGIVYWLEQSMPNEEPASIERMAFPLPDKPSIAVLPFTNMSDLPEQEYFVDGMTDDLITDISKMSELFVISRNSVFTYKGKAVKIRQVAEELGVRYVMEGSVQRVGNDVRINAQLIDATTGGHIWAGRYDGSVENVFSMRDEITRKIVAELSVKFAGPDRAGQGHVNSSNPEANDAFFQGRAYYQLLTPNDLVKAILHLENAIALDPEFERAHETLAAAYWEIYLNNWADVTGISYDEALEKTNRHLKQAMKNPTPLALRILSRQHIIFGNWDDAMVEAERAIALDPNNPDGYLAMGRLLVRQGRAGKGLEMIKTAMRLDPQTDYLHDLGNALYHMERYDEAATVYQRATKRNPDSLWSYFELAAAFGHLGREQEATSALASFNELYRHPAGPKRPFTLAYFDTWTFKVAANRERLREGLRKAGVPAGDTVEPDNKHLDLITVTEGTFHVAGANEINATEAKALHDNGIVFIDSRGKSAYEDEHIPGAINLLVHKISSDLSDLTGQDAQVVFYCDRPKCHLAAHSSARAVVLGYTRVYYFAGGLLAWKAAGYAVEGP